MQTNDENAIFTLSGFPCAQTAFTTTYYYARVFCPNIFIIYRTCGVFLACSVTVILPNSLLLEPNGILTPTLPQCWRSSHWKIIIVQVCGEMFAEVITKYSLRGRWWFVVATTPTAMWNNNLRICVCVCKRLHGVRWTRETNPLGLMCIWMEKRSHVTLFFFLLTTNMDYVLTTMGPIGTRGCGPQKLDGLMLFKMDC